MISHKYYNKIKKELPQIHRCILIIIGYQYVAIRASVAKKELATDKQMYPE